MHTINKIDTFILILIFCLCPFDYFDNIFRSVTSMDTGFLYYFVAILSLARLLTLRLENNFYHGQKSDSYIIVHAKYFLIFIFLITLLITSFRSVLTNIYNLDSTTFTGIDRVTTQRFIKFIGLISINFYILYLSKTKYIISIMITYFSIGLFASEIIGIIQLIVFWTLSIDIFPLHDVITPTINIGGINIMRIRSISHEPKGLGILVSNFLILKIYLKSSKIYINQIIDKYITSIYSIILSIFVILFTFSNSAIVFLGISLLLLYLHMRCAFNKSNKIAYNKMDKLVIFFLILAMTLFLFFPSLGNDLSLYAEAMISRRGEIKASTLDDFYAFLDPEDSGMLYLFFEHLNVLVSGYGFGAFTILTTDLVRSIYHDNEFVSFSRAYLFELTASGGIISLVLAIRFYKRFIFNYIALVPILPVFSTLLISNFLVRTSELLFFVFLAISISTVNVYLNEQHTITSKT